MRAFAPGRVNLIGEHTDYNDGLSLAFAIDRGVTAEASPAQGQGAAGYDSPLVAAVAQELELAGHPVPRARIAIRSDLAEGEGLSSSAAVAVASALALLGLADERLEPPELAEVCRRAERRALGTRAGLLDPLASLCGTPGHAVLIDFRTLEWRPVEIDLGGWRLGVAASGERRELAASGYNERRAECEQARDLLGLASLRDAGEADAGRLGPPLGDRLRHVMAENERVEQAVAALGRGDLEALGRVLDASHVSLRDLYEASTEAVERTVDGLRAAGAAGARMMGGGFGGSVLALFAPDAKLPEGVRAVAPAGGAHARPARA